MTGTTLLTVEQVPIDQLRPDPANPRRISEEELDSLERGLRQFGFVQLVLARREDRTVIAPRLPCYWRVALTGKVRRGARTGMVMSGIFAAAAAIWRPFRRQPPPSAVVQAKEPDPLTLRVEPGPRFISEQQRPVVDSD